MNTRLLAVLRPFVSAFVEKAQQLPPGNVTSWLRTDARNQAVGGARNSQHLLALAVDVVPAGSRSEFVAAARRLGLVAIDEGDHVHVQAYPAGTLDFFIEAARSARLL